MRWVLFFLVAFAAMWIFNEVFYDDFLTRSGQANYDQAFINKRDYIASGSTSGLSPEQIENRRIQKNDLDRVLRQIMNRSSYGKKIARIKIENPRHVKVFLKHNYIGDKETPAATTCSDLMQYGSDNRTKLPAGQLLISVYSENGKTLFHEQFCPFLKDFENGVTLTYREDLPEEGIDNP